MMPKLRITMVYEGEEFGAQYLVDDHKYYKYLMSLRQDLADMDETPLYCTDCGMDTPPCPTDGLTCARCCDCDECTAKREHDHSRGEAW